MSAPITGPTDPTTKPAPTAPGPSAPGAPPVDPPKDEPLAEPGKAALAAERKARKDAEQQLKELTDRLQAIEDKDKSELEKAQAKAAKLEADYAAADAERLRLTKAAEHGIPADLHHLLTATDPEALEAQAVTVAELAKARTTPAFAANVGQGAGSNTPPPSLSQQIAAAEAAGDWAQARRLKSQQLINTPVPK